MARPVLLGVLGVPQGSAAPPQHVGHPATPPCHSRGPSQHFLCRSGTPVSLWLIGDAPWSASPRPPFLAAAHGQATLADGPPSPLIPPRPSPPRSGRCRAGGGRSGADWMCSSCPRTGLPTDAFPFLPSEPLWLALCWGCSRAPVSPASVVCLSLRAACPALTRLRLPAVSSFLGGPSRLDTHPRS